MATSRRTKRMERIRKSGTLALAVAVAAFGLAAAPRAAEAQIACGARIGPNEEVVLASTLECDDPADAIEIEGPAVLDLNGFAIQCRDTNSNGRVPSFGIRASGTGALIRNGVVVGCGIGILLAGEGGHRVEEMRVVSTLGDGLVAGTDRNQIVNSSVSFAGADGFDVFGEQNLILATSAVGSGENGFRTGNKTVLRGNISSSNSSTGFLVGGQGSLVAGNRAVDNPRGFLVLGQKNRLLDNQGESNTSGVVLDGPASANKLARNEMNGNGFAGFFVLGRGNTLSKNRAEDGDFGFFVVSSATGNVIRKNETRNSGDTDLVDQAIAATGDCRANRWKKNEFESSNHPCIE